jgi:two-component system, cell cycle response regulator
MKIMLVEDSALERDRIGNYLKQWNLEYLEAEDGRNAWEVIQKPDAPDLVLLDWLLPGLDGLELCRKIRTLGANGCYIYTVMLTALEKKQHLLAAMNAGADDYLGKPVDPSELRARIMVGKRILDLHQSLRFAATHDFLTKLSNRAEIIAALGRELARSERDDKPVAILLADVDYFKNVNDSLGHVAGDAVLREVAQRLKADLRAYDLAGRYGGEEFLLILPNCDLGVAARRADEIRSFVSKAPVVTPAGAIQVTVSLGVTVRGSDAHQLGIEDLLQEADLALYRAKKGGRNCVQVFSRASGLGA